MQAAPVEAEIGPRQPDQLRAAQPVVGGDVEQRVEPLGFAGRVLAGLQGVQERAALLAGPEPLTGAGDLPRPGPPRPPGSG